MLIDFINIGVIDCEMVCVWSATAEMWVDEPVVLESNNINII